MLLEIVQAMQGQTNTLTQAKAVFTSRKQHCQRSNAIQIFKVARQLFGKQTK